MADIAPLLKRSATDVYATPQWLYDALNSEFGFTLDPCSDGVNAKCTRFYTPAEDGLARDWGSEIVYMNPPYSDVGTWMRKAYEASRAGATVVCLIAARTDSNWWHDYAMKGEVRFIRGRLRFGDVRRRFGSTGSAPFPSAIVVFRPAGFQLMSAKI